MDLVKLKEILYLEDKSEMIKNVQEISDMVGLHIFSNNYNWDNGIEVPYAIINNEVCDLGTALSTFYFGEGYFMLSDNEGFENSRQEEWKMFMKYLYKKIFNIEFQTSIVEFSPPLTKVQVFKLKKNNIPSVFIEKMEGEVIESVVL